MRYKVIRNSMITLATLGGVLIVMSAIPRVGLPIFGLLVVVALAYLGEGVIVSLPSGRTYHYQGQPKNWWLTETRESARLRKAKALTKLRADRLKERGKK